MTLKILTLAATLGFAISGAAVAQTPAGGGKAEGNMNSPGSVKSNSQKSMEGGAGSMSTGMTTGTAGANTGPGTGNAKSTDGVTGNAGARAPK